MQYGEFSKNSIVKNLGKDQVLLPNVVPQNFIQTTHVLTKLFRKPAWLNTNDYISQIICQQINVQSIDHGGTKSYTSTR